MDDLYCYICLLEGAEQPSAPDTLAGGTAVCRKHLDRVANRDVLGTTPPAEVSTT